VRQLFGRAAFLFVLCPEKILRIEFNFLKSRSFLDVACSVAFRSANMQDRPNFDEIVSTVDSMIRKQGGYGRSYTV